jgi:hypothetical protein
MFRKLEVQIHCILVEGNLLLLLEALLKPQNIDDSALGTYLSDPFPHPSDLMLLQISEKYCYLRVEALR